MRNRGFNWLVAGAASLAVGAAALVAAGFVILGRGDGGAGAGGRFGLGPGASGYNIIFAAREFVVGPNRFPFAIALNDEQLIGGADVTVEFAYLGSGEPEPGPTLPARFVQFTGSGVHRHIGKVAPHKHVALLSIYIVEDVDLDRPGVWEARVDATTADGKRIFVEPRPFLVTQEPTAPGVGQPVPPSYNPTVRDVDSIWDIESRIPPDDMHDLSIAEALEQQRPFVVVFSTPAFCVSRLCGPTLEVAVAAQARYGDRVNFLHIEPWDLRRAREEGRLVPTETMLQWHLQNEPWTFVVGADGRVSSGFEGPLTPEELEGAIQRALGERPARP